jgi:tetratricopeptide (TPR) repeat protein
VAYGERAVAMRTEVFGENHGLVASSLHNLVRTYLMLNKLDQALAVAEANTRISRAVYGTHHPWTQGAMHWQARALESSGDLQAALALRRELLALSLADEEILPFDLAESRRFLGSLLVTLGQYEEAEALLRVAQATLDEPGLPIMATREANRTKLAQAIYRSGRLEEAYVLLQRRDDSPSSGCAGTDADLEREMLCARLYAASGDAQRAFQLVENAIGDFEAQSVLDELRKADAWYVYATLLMDAGRPADARGAFGKAAEIYARHRGDTFWRYRLAVAGAARCDTDFTRDGKPAEIVRDVVRLLRPLLGEDHPEILRLE